jgi:ketosteroid isomerase-like protein
MTALTRTTSCITVLCLGASLAVAQDTTPQTQTNTPQTQVTPQTQAAPQDAKQAERDRKQKEKQDKQAAKDAERKAKADAKAAKAMSEAGGKKSEQGQPAGEKVAAGGNAEQALLQIEQELLDALLKGDTSAGERHLADTFVFTGPDGAVQDKARLIADMKSGDLKIESSTNEDMKVQVHGDAAVVTYRSTDKGSYKGNDLSGQYRWTDMFVKRNGRWQLVAGQGTRIMQQQPTQ